MIKKTTVYLLSDDKIDSIDFIIRCIAHYLVDHPEDMDFAKRISSQLFHCRDMFTEVYKP